MKRELKLGRLRVEFFTSDMNWHGPRIGPAEFATLRKGGKIVNMHVANPLRAYWGWRFIRYSADGSWRCLGLYWLLREAPAPRQ